MNTNLIVGLIIIIGSLSTAFILLCRELTKNKVEISKLKETVKNEEKSFDAMMDFYRNLFDEEKIFKEKEKPQDATDRLSRLNSINKL